MMVVLFLDILILDESYPPVLLVYKAQKLRHDSGNWALHAKHEEWDISLKELGNKCQPLEALLGLQSIY